MDALTEASFTTHRSTDAGAAAANEYEQDLTGFDHLDSGSTSHSHHHKIQSREPAGSPRHAASSNSGNDSSSSAMHSKATIESIQAGGLQVFPRSPRIPAAGTYNKAVNNLHGSIAPFEVGLSPEEEKAAIQQEKARQAAFQQAELQKMRQKMEDQLRMELNDALSQHSQRSWRDIFCCCLPTKQVSRSMLPGQNLACVLDCCWLIANCAQESSDKGVAYCHTLHAGHHLLVWCLGCVLKTINRPCALQAILAAVS
eukprot:GHRR01034540.1.p1 GENE.GHRR01034540.1~~GHRR01034540.1.p1  ORF type:complete len:256 (+),score=70.23 GHRR01034540.1:186-953(+)